MELQLKRLTVGILPVLVAATLLTAPPSASAQLDVLPTLTLPEVLALADIDAPPEGIGLRIHADFPAEAPAVIDGVALHALTVDVTPDGGVITQNAVPAATSSGAASGADTDECSDETFDPSGPTWKSEDIPIYWKFRMASVPTKMLRPNRTLWQIRLAHQVWPRVKTNCTAEPNGFHFSYVGEDNSRHSRYDGVNLVEFANFDSGALAVNYTWYSDGRIREVDLKFNKAQYRWTNVKHASQGYHVINVATHELGHQLGLDDLSDPHGALTMFARIGKGEKNKVTLGRGDIRGAARISP